MQTADERQDIARWPVRLFDCGCVCVCEFVSDVSVALHWTWFVTTSTRSSGQRGSKIYVLNIIYIYFIVFFTVFRRWYMGYGMRVSVAVCMCARALVLHAPHTVIQLHFCERTNERALARAHYLVCWPFHLDDEMVTIKQNSFVSFGSRCARRLLAKRNGDWRMCALRNSNPFIIISEHIGECVAINLHAHPNTSPSNMSAQCSCGSHSRSILLIYNFNFNSIFFHSLFALISTACRAHRWLDFQCEHK